MIAGEIAVLTAIDGLERNEYSGNILQKYENAGIASLDPI
jgi:hypothetical protein